MTEQPLAVTRVADQIYDTPGGVELRADLYLPPQPVGLAPVIVWVHGGGWRYGNRRLAPDLTRFFAVRGFAMVAIDYRLSDRAVFPAQIEDLRAAIRWVRSIATIYRLNAERVGLWGVSAGGHLAALAALSPASLFVRPDSRHGEYQTFVQAVTVGYAPIDFLQLDRDRPAAGTVPDDPENLALPAGMRSVDPHSFESQLLGAPIGTCRDRVQQANPVTYARPGAPPFLILHGLSDTTVGAHQSALLYDALAAHGNDVTLCLVERLGHGFLNRSHLDDGSPWRMMRRRCRQGRQEVEQLDQPIFPLIESFFRLHLCRSDSQEGGRGESPSSCQDEF